MPSLDTHVGLIFNDHDCHYDYEQYVCSTNRWDPEPPPSPPSPPPPSPPPYPPHYDSCSAWCADGGECANATRLIKILGKTHEVFCIYDGYRGVDFQLVTDGRITHRFDQPNSCPVRRAACFPLLRCAPHLVRTR